MVKRLKEVEQVDQIMQQQFPSFYQFILDSNDINTKKGKKNVLSVNNQWTEGGLVLNKLYKQLESNTKNTVHDAVYVDEQEYSKELEEQMLEQWKEIISKIIFPKSEEEQKFDDFMNQTIKDLEKIGV